MARKRCCFFLCSEGSVYWKILGKGETVASTFSCEQLEEMKVRFPAGQRQGKILLIMGISTLHREKITQQKLKDLEMDWLPLPPYSPDISPCDFHAFWNLENSHGRQALQVLQGRGVHTGHLDRDQASRLLEERTRATARAMEKNRKNTAESTTIAGKHKLLTLVIKLKFKKVSSRVSP